MSWEVQTMPSKTSFFNRTVFLSDLRRCWPLTAGYALIWFLILPLSRFTELSHTSPYLNVWNIRRDTLEIAANGGYLAAFLVGILFAMGSFSHLTNARATYGLHALPARRETLYVTHYLSGLCAQFAALVLSVALTAAVLAAHGAADARLAGLMLLALLLPVLFFYSFAVFCMIFTGQSLAAPVFYFILNIVVVGVEVLVRTFAGNFLYGWSGNEDPELLAFSPIVQLFSNGVRAAMSNLMFGTGGALNGGAKRLSLRGFDWLLIYAAAGLVFAVLGLLVYRARHSEATGSVVAVYWARPIFKYGVTFCAAMALGQLIYELFFGMYRSNGDNSLPEALGCMAAAGLIGYFAAEMLLKKSFRVWRTGWKGAAAVTLAMLALGFAMSLDLTGYESYVPDPGRVQAVQIDMNIYTGGGYCYAVAQDEETIRLAVDAHRALVKDKRVQQTADYSVPYADGTNDLVSGYFDVRYTLRSGRVVSRSYQPILLDRGTLEDASSPAAALTAVYNAPAVALKRVLGRDGYQQGKSELRDLRFTGGYVEQPQYVDGEYLYGEDRDLTPAEAQRIYDAVRRDVELGNAERSLFDDEPELRSSLHLYASYIDPGDRYEPQEGTGENGRSTTVFMLSVTERMTETAAVLRDLGIEVNFYS